MKNAEIQKIVVNYIKLKDINDDLDDKFFLTWKKVAIRLQNLTEKLL